MLTSNIRLRLLRSTFTFLGLLSLQPLMAQVDLSNGLVAYYPFNGNTNDESGNSNNGSPTNIAFTADALGNPNSACYLDGLTSFIEISASASLNTTKLLTVAAKYYQEEPGNANFLLLRGGPFSGGKDMYHLNFSAIPPQNNIFFDVWEPFACTQLVQNGVVAGINTDEPLGKWHCVVGTFDGTSVNIYLDGTLRDSRPASFTEVNMCDGTAPVFIGRPLRDYYMSYKGKLDEIRIYNRPLSVAEVQAYSDVCGVEAVNVAFGFNNADSCLPGKFQFQDQTTASGISIISRTWQFGDNSSVTANNPQHTYSKTGTYNVTLVITGSNNMTYTFSQSVQVTKTSARFASAGNDTSFCPGKNVQLTASGGVSYQWEPCSFLSDCSIVNPVATPTSRQVYTVTATNSKGCTDTSSIVIDVRRNFASAGADLLVCDNQPVSLSATGGIHYSWEPCNLLVDCKVSNPVLASLLQTEQQFIVTVTDKYQCTETDSVLVSYGDLATQIFIPNSFTPNGDGINDLFRVTCKVPVPSFHLEIFNRWGHKVFESFDLHSGWNETVNSARPLAGTYTYHLQIKSNSLKCGNIDSKGPIFLIQ